MGNFDDIFDTPPLSPKESSMENKSFDKDNFDKEKWKEKKQGERDEVYALIDKTAEDICTDGDKFKNYLDVQSRFDRYSAGNALLILAQKSNATRLGDYDYWRDRDTNVKKHQSGISILEPGEEYTREDGSTGISYNVKKVFDISQTNTKEKAQQSVSHDNRLLLKALINNSPVTIKMTDELEGNSGALYDHKSQTVYVRKGMDAPDIFRSLSNELAHAELVGEDYSRSHEGFRAYCVSYMLCKKHGVDISGYDFGGIPSLFKETDAQAIKAELSVIRDTVAEISTRMSKVLEPPKNEKQQQNR
jgi:hypothetical protein